MVAACVKTGWSAKAPGLRYLHRVSRPLVNVRKLGPMTASPPTVKVFTSWSHEDRGLKDKLLPRLTSHLDLLSGVRIELWDDTQLQIGEDFTDTITDKITRCDYGLLLLSQHYLNSDFIRDHELPRFVGPEADKGALPVALRPLPFDGSRDLRGIERRVVFQHRGKAFLELRTDNERNTFASELATQIRSRVLPDAQG